VVCAGRDDLRIRGAKRYVESCTMFTRGGVYRVVKEAMGGPLAKLSVSALMFDYILTGPISGFRPGNIWWAWRGICWR